METVRNMSKVDRLQELGEWYTRAVTWDIGRKCVEQDFGALKWQDESVLEAFVYSGCNFTVVFVHQEDILFMGVWNNFGVAVPGSNSEIEIVTIAV